MSSSITPTAGRVRTTVIRGASAALIALGSLLLAGTPGAAALSTTPVTPPDDVVPTTPVAPTTPVTPVTTPVDPNQPTDDSTNWAPILVVLGGVIVVVAIVAMLMSRRPAASKAQTARPTTAAPPSARSNLLSTSQWIHDQLTLELLSAQPDVAMQRWATERSRLDDVAIGAQQQFTEGHGELWQRLGQTVSTLATAIDTNLQVRNQQPVDATLVQESNAVVNRDRAALQQLITALRPTA